MKIIFPVFLIFSLRYYFSLAAEDFGSNYYSELDSELGTDPSKNPNATLKPTHAISNCSLKCESPNIISNSLEKRIQALESLQKLETSHGELTIKTLKESVASLENKNRELKRSHEELQEQLKTFRSSQKKRDEQFKSLKKEMEQLKNENCVGDDVWLLTPPLRGRRGQKGEKGDSGVITTKSGEESGQNREKAQGQGQGQLAILSPSQSPTEQDEEEGDDQLIQPTDPSREKEEDQVPIQAESTTPRQHGDEALSGVQVYSIHPNCTDNPFFANCKIIVKASYCTNRYYTRFCCKSCTQAGQLPTHGPHLKEYDQGF